MARTDETPIQVTSPDYRPSHRSELQDWLMKEAEGGIKPDSNEATQKKPVVDLYADPPGRQDGQNEDARWGEETQGELNHHNDSTYDETKKDRLGALGKAFTKLPAAQAQAGSAVSQLFDHGRSGQFTAHSAELLGKAKLAAPAPTLADRVRNLTGRR
jgi:hypothetical protein